MITKNVDDKGRVTLGRRFANRTVIIREVDETEVVITLARAVPERELWLHRNRKAKKSVLRGLEEARAGRFSKSPPNLRADKTAVDRRDD